MQFLLNYCQATGSLACGCCHNLLLHTVNVGTWLASGHFFFLFFLLARRVRVPLPALEGMECSKCGVAFVATCEIWFGEGCHLKGPGSAVMTAPEHSLTQSRCLFQSLCITASLRHLSFTHSLTPFHSLAPHLPVAHFYWAALKPDVRLLGRWGGRCGDSSKDEGQPNDLWLQCSSFSTQYIHFLFKTLLNLYIHVLYFYLILLLSQDLAHNAPTCTN